MDANISLADAQCRITRDFSDILPTKFREEYNESILSAVSVVRAIALLATTIATFLVYQLVFVRKVGWEGTRMGPRVMMDEIIKHILYIIALFSLGNYAETLTLLALAIIPMSAIAFGGLGQIPFLKNNLTNFFRDPRAIPVYVSAGVIILGFVGYFLWEAVESGIIVYFLIGLAMVIIAVGAFIATGIAKKIKIHPHHWSVFYLLAYFTRFPGIISNVCAGICIGIYVHGASSFGTDSAFF